MKELVLFFVTLIVTFNSYALSATTARTIQGTRPVVVTGSGNTSLVARSSFTVNGTTYKEFDNSYNNTVVFPNNLTLNHFSVIGLRSTDFQSWYFSDSDGDIPHSTTALDTGTLSYRWIDNNNSVVDPTNYNNTLLDLSSMSTTGVAYRFPLTLEITNSDVKVYSQYGDPYESLGVILKKSYKINYEAGFYAIKPASTGKSCQWLEKLPGVSFVADTYADSFVCSSEATPGQTGHRDTNVVVIL